MQIFIILAGAFAKLMQLSDQTRARALNPPCAFTLFLPSLSTIHAAIRISLSFECNEFKNSKPLNINANIKVCYYAN